MQAVAIFIVTKYLNYLGPITVPCVDKMGPRVDTETSSAVMGGAILRIKEMLKNERKKLKCKSAVQSVGLQCSSPQQPSLSGEYSGPLERGLEASRWTEGCRPHPSVHCPARDVETADRRPHFPTAGAGMRGNSSC